MLILDNLNKLLVDIGLKWLMYGDIGFIRVKEEEWRGFAKGWQGCSKGFPEGEAQRKSRGAALPAEEKPSPT